MENDGGVYKGEKHQKIPPIKVGNRTIKKLEAVVDIMQNQFSNNRMGNKLPIKKFTNFYKS